MTPRFCACFRGASPHCTRGRSPTALAPLPLARGAPPPKQGSYAECHGSTAPPQQTCPLSPPHNPIIQHNKSQCKSEQSASKKRREGESQKVVCPMGHTFLSVSTQLASLKGSSGRRVSSFASLGARYTQPHKRGAKRGVLFRGRKRQRRGHGMSAVPTQVHRVSRSSGFAAPNRALRRK